MIARIVKIRAGILITLKPMVLSSILAVLAGLALSDVWLFTMAYTLLCVVGAAHCRYVTAAWAGGAIYARA